MIEKPCWTQTLSAWPEIPAGELPESCDTAVIGGGITGLSTALHLARRGANVVLLEQHHIGWGASTRNAGMTLVGLKRSPGQLIKKYGLSDARKYYQVSIDAVDFAETFITGENLDCDFDRHGALWAAYTTDHYEALKDARELLQKTFNHKTHLVPAAEMKTELGSNHYHGGLVDPLSAGLNPAKYVAGLLAKALAAGVKIFAQTRVEKFHRHTTGFRVHTNRGAVLADHLVAATNGYTPPALPWLRRRIIPIGSYIIATEPLENTVAAEIIPRNRMVYDTRKYLSYFRLTPDCRMLFGGRTSFVGHHNQTAAAILQRWMCDVFPQLRGVRIDYCWSGYVGFTFDQMPHLGVNDGVYYAMGYCGHGVAPGLYFGNHLARLISGEKTDLPFADLDYPGMLFYRKRAWFLPVAGLYYKLVDNLAQRRR